MFSTEENLTTNDNLAISDLVALNKVKNISANSPNGIDTTYSKHVTVFHSSYSSHSHAFFG